MYKWMTSVALLLLSACANNSNSGATTSDSATTETAHANAGATGQTGAQPMVLAGCYQMTLQRDTATLQLSVADTTVTGNLRYDFYEKDRSNGTLSGVLRNDRIYANYQFQSEGMTSVREVIFKIENGGLVEAYGPLTEKDAKMVFSDTAALQFQTDHPFVKVPCRN